MWNLNQHIHLKSIKNFKSDLKSDLWDLKEQQEPGQIPNKGGFGVRF
jgi:hypothetical protein